MALRTQYGVNKVVSGLTGTTQISGGDKLSIPDKVKLDVGYVHRQSFWLDLDIIFLIFLNMGYRDGANR